MDDLPMRKIDFLDRSNGNHIATNREQSRRTVLLAGLALAATVGERLRAETVVELDWMDLIPADDGTIREVTRGVVQHEDAFRISQRPGFSDVRTDLNGQIVRLPGYTVPVDFSGADVIAFLLVPFVGACIHVPPPPSNQLVFVTSETPYASQGLFEAVQVTGEFQAASTSTAVAEIGYMMTAHKIEPHS